MSSLWLFLKQPSHVLTIRIVICSHNQSFWLPMPDTDKQKWGREAVERSLQTVICTEWATGQLLSPREAESSTHGENESPRIPRPERGISFLRDKHRTEKPRLWLMSNEESSRQITRAQNISYHMNPLLLSARWIKFGGLERRHSQKRGW